MFVLAIFFLIFWFPVIRNPFYYAYGEALDCDFPTFRLCGEYWRRFKIPEDPYYFKDLIGARAGTLYPVNIVMSWISSFFNVNGAWIVYVITGLAHFFATSVLAYFMFGQGPYGIFGALAWAYGAYHIKTTLWYLETFTWITAAITFAELHMPFWSGISLGMLLLAGHPVMVVYFSMLFVPYLIIKQFMPSPIYLALGFYQWWRYFKYSKISVRKSQVADDTGNLPFWVYLLSIFPIRYREFISKIGPEEWSFYVGPVVFALALFGRGHCWALIAIAIVLSTGRFNFLKQRFAYRWGYFAMLGIVVLAVDGLRSLNTSQLTICAISVITAISLLHNQYLIRPYPFAQFTERPSKYFLNSFLKYLEFHAKGYRVNNLPYPVYTGQINHIQTPGYTGGNHIASLGRFLNIPTHGTAPYNWFDHLPDDSSLDYYKIKYHVGSRPSDDPKWEQVYGYDNLWVNKNV
ncbi:MAG TPA: hypothetical protein P5110_09610 [Candidatus Omnitrophota bacterium]|nr:hypothetical protein [Candidatus Omnitrophota bacterium]